MVFGTRDLKYWVLGPSGSFKRSHLSGCLACDLGLSGSATYRGSCGALHAQVVLQDSREVMEAPKGTGRESRGPIGPNQPYHWGHISPIGIPIECMDILLGAI